MENPQKVQKKLNELNRGLAKRPWIALPGFNAMTGFSFGPTGNSPKFEATSGYPVKVFVNSINGEVKAFSAFLFKD